MVKSIRYKEVALGCYRHAWQVKDANTAYGGWLRSCAQAIHWPCENLVLEWHTHGQVVTVAGHPHWTFHVQSEGRLCGLRGYPLPYVDLVSYRIGEVEIPVIHGDAHQLPKLH